MRMMKQANPAKFIMMLLLLIGKQAFFLKHEIRICLGYLFLVYFFITDCWIVIKLEMKRPLWMMKMKMDFWRPLRLTVQYYLAYTFFFSKCLFNFDLFTLFCSELRDALDFYCHLSFYSKKCIWTEIHKSIKSKLVARRTGLTYVFTVDYIILTHMFFIYNHIIG